MLNQILSNFPHFQVTQNLQTTEPNIILQNLTVKRPNIYPSSNAYIKREKSSCRPNNLKASAWHVNKAAKVNTTTA
jgi:hypothetical protein